MTLATANELKAEIVADIARSDVTTSSADLNRFIVQAERFMEQGGLSSGNKQVEPLRIKEMIKKQALTVAARNVSLNADFLEIDHIEFDDSPQFLERNSRRNMAASNQGVNANRPVGYDLVWDPTGKVHQLRFGPIPDGSRTASLEYYAELDTLADDTNTDNPTFLKYPDLYLSGCLYFAFKKYRNKALWPDQLDLFSNTIKALNRADKSAIIGPGSRVAPLRRL